MEKVKISAQSKNFLRMSWMFFKKGFFHGLLYEFGNQFRMLSFLKGNITYYDRFRLFFLKWISFIL